MDEELQNSSKHNDSLDEIKDIRKTSQEAHERFEMKYADKKKLLADSLKEVEAMKEILGHVTTAVKEIAGNLRVGDADGGLISMLEALKKLQVESSSTINDGVHEGDRLIILRSKKPEHRYDSHICPFGIDDNDLAKAKD